MIQGNQQTALTDRNAKIYVAGHTGLVGSALIRELQAGGYKNLVTCAHRDLDLTDQQAVKTFFERQRPEYVFLTAAKVGGILANSTYSADFIHDNLNIEINVIHESHRASVKRLIFFGSSCIYPKRCPQPIREEYFLTSALESTNRPNAVAKIAAIEMCWAYNRQHETQFLATMPSNLYGPGDNYDLKNAHVLPALMRKVHEAKVERRSEVVVWGTGSPRREFLYSDDLADACLHLMRLPDQEYLSLVHNQEQHPIVNVGCGEDVTIRELAETICRSLEFSGKLVFDPSKPDGTPRKLLDVSRLSKLGWKSRTCLREGLRRTYADFLARSASQRATA